MEAMMARKQFPEPDERARIMARRERLSHELIEYMITRSADEQEARAQLNPLVREHGFDEVYRMLKRISPRLQVSADPDEDERLLYAEYVNAYGRFGGERQFLSFEEFLRLNRERGRLLSRTILGGEQLPEADQQRLSELTDTLLSEPFLWDDLVPENPPKAFGSEEPTPTRKVGRNEPCPCGSGRKYKHCHGR
jgi:hypothetical protein